MPEIYKGIVSPILDRLDSETWHVRAREALHVAESTPFTLKLLEQFADQRERFTDERLHVVVGGIEFENPVMVGAGWDKAGRAVQALHALGFSGVEVGSVLAYPQPGNDKPRQFMMGPGVALNRLGFNSLGMDAVANNLERYRGSGIPIGISIGKNKLIPNKAAPEMHAEVVKRLYPYASYIALNVSSPNTPGLRGLQEKGELTDNVEACNATMDEMGGRIPFFVKIAPDLEEEAVDDIIQVVADNGMTGIIDGNTTIQSVLKAKYGERWRNEAGGLSGDDKDFRKMVTKQIAHIYRETGGKMEIIGIGGVKNAVTALEKIQAGARVVQIVTAIRGEGPAVAGRVNRGLVQYMERDGIKNIGELVGAQSINY